jgi:hypothetical protein
MGQYRFREKGGSVGFLSRKPKQRKDEPLIAAASWAESVRRGGVPEPVHAPILLGEGERAYARIPAAVDHFAAADATYNQGFLLAGGSVAGLADTAIGSAIFNASARPTSWAFCVALRPAPTTLPAGRAPTPSCGRGWRR